MKHCLQNYVRIGQELLVLLNSVQISRDLTFFSVSDFLMFLLDRRSRSIYTCKSVCGKKICKTRTLAYGTTCMLSHRLHYRLTFVHSQHIPDRFACTRANKLACFADSPLQTFQTIPIGASLLTFRVYRVFRDSPSIIIIIIFFFFYIFEIFLDESGVSVVSRREFQESLSHRAIFSWLFKCFKN